MPMVIINKWSNLIRECLDWITEAWRCAQTQTNRKTETERQAEPVEGVTQVDRGRWIQVYTGTS